MLLSIQSRVCAGMEVPIHRLFMRYSAQNWKIETLNEKEETQRDKNVSNSLQRSGSPNRDPFENSADGLIFSFGECLNTF